MNNELIVSDYMTRKVVVAGLHNKISELMRFCLTHKIQHLPVTENELLVGIVSLHDVMRVIHEELLAGNTINEVDIDKKYQLSNIMTADPISISPETKISDALRLLHLGAFQALPVVENEKVVGIITNKDMVDLFALESNPPHPSFTIENPGYGI
jgi:CBS domain-containing protein